MALIDKASLLMVSSTYEAGKLYNVLPSGNRAPDSTNQNSGYDQTRADFTFDRGSNASATRVNADGLIEKGRENHFLQSNNFGTTWSTSAASVTGGQADKDGGTDAWKLQDTAATSEHWIRQTPSQSGLVTLSVYAKANTLDFIWLRGVTSGSNVRAWFNLSSGTLGSTTSGVIDSAIEAVGTDGWYRCSMTLNHQSGFEYYIAISNADNTTSYAGDGAGSVFIMNSQLEIGLVATDYIATGSTTATAGILVDLPRINYDANGENGALLLEPSRVNLITHSEYFGTWSIAQMSIENNFATSPEGIKNATRLIENTAAGTAHSVNLSTQTTQTEHAFSVYAKPNGRNYIYMYVGGGPGQGTIIDIVNGTKGNNVGNAPNDTIIEPVGNGWFRCTILFNGIAGTPTPTIGLANTSSSFTYTGDGTSGVLIYGGQVESGSYATSYIPTMGTSETRAADSCSVTGVSDVIGQTEGTMFFELTTIANSQYKRLSLNNGSYTNSIVFDFQDNNVLIAKAFNGGIPILSISSSVAIADIRKIAIAYKNNDYAFYVNGSLMGTLTSIVVPSGLSAFGFDLAGNQKFEGNIKQALLFKERLTNAELATLTTL